METFIMSTYQVNTTVKPDGSIFFPMKWKNMANHEVKIIIFDVEKKQKAIAGCRGILKSEGISTSEYFRFKKEDKKLEI